MGWISNNAGLKVTSLVLATCAWFFVKGITSDSRPINGVPLEIKVKPGLTVLATSTATVNVTVRGTREDVRRSRGRFVRGGGFDPDQPFGINHHALSPSSVRHPPRVQVTEVDPAE